MTVNFSKILHKWGSNEIVSSDILNTFFILEIRWKSLIQVSETSLALENKIPSISTMHRCKSVLCFCSEEKKVF